METLRTSSYLIPVKLESEPGKYMLIHGYYNPQIEMFARFKMKSSFHKTKRII